MKNLLILLLVGFISISEAQKIKYGDFSPQLKSDLKDTTRSIVSDSIAVSETTFRDTINQVQIDSINGWDRITTVIPDTIYGVSGETMYIYWDNIFTFPRTDLFFYDVTSDSGAQDSRSWSWTPTASAHGFHSWSVEIINPYTLYTYGTYSTIIKIDSAGYNYNDSVKVMFTGNSLLASGHITTEILNNYIGDASTDTLILLGTQGSGTNLHEGYGGKKYSWFATDASSPFTNGGVLDFGNYFENTIADTPNFVGFFLGTNDIFIATDSTIDSLTALALAYADTLIDSLLVISDSLTIGVWMIPPSSSQDGFGANYGNGQSWWQYEKNRKYFNQQLLSHSFSSNVHIIPITGLDRIYNFQTSLDSVNSQSDSLVIKIDNGVHPNNDGYHQLGDMVYYWLKQFRSNVGLGAELITNGTFISDTSHWTWQGTPDTFEWVASGGGYTGALHITTNANNTGMKTTDDGSYFSITSGNTYRLRYDLNLISSVSGGVKIAVWTGAANDYDNNISVDGIYSIDVEFDATNTSSSSFIWVYTISSPTSCEFYIDNISLREVF